MKIPHIFRFCSLFVLLLGSAFAQDGDRFIIEPIQPDPAISPHQDLVATVQGVGGDIYLDVDRPEVLGNFVAAFLEPAEVQVLRQNRPDLIVDPDLEIEPNSVGGGGIPWSLDRIDQKVNIDKAYYPDMLQPCEEIRPYVYICDTGIRSNHDEFVGAGSRLSLVESYIAPALPRITHNAWEDPYDHGTGVASCAVGENLGSGRCPANVVSAVCYPDPVSFPGVTGSFVSFASDAIYWCIDEHNARAGDDNPFNDASVLVFASSTTTGPSTILDLAVQRAYLAGMTVVVSAGNQALDASTTSPAGATTTMMGDITLTVGASTSADARWPNSNHGALVEMFAPGESVLAASGLDSSTCVLRSGTSCAAGYVAGAAARLLTRNPWASPADVVTVLTDTADPDYGPSGPFGSGINAVPKLLYVNPDSVKCLPLMFDDWMQLFETHPAAPPEDADCDGLVNAVEYVMALDPSKWATEEERPLLSLVDGGASYRFRLADYLCETGVSVRVEYSTDLIHWTELPDDAIVADEEGTSCTVGFEWMSASIPIDGERLYVRLRVLGL